MVSVKWLNDKGNVSVKVRDGVRSQVKDVFKLALTKQFGNNVVENANGGYSIPVATNATTNDVIYAHFTFTVNDKNPADIGEKKKGKKTAVSTEPIPTLFAVAEDEDDTDED